MLPTLILLVAPALVTDEPAEEPRREVREAIERLGREIEKRPEDAELYLLRAWARHEAKEYEKAIEDCDRALSLGPKLARAINLRGHLHLKLGEFRKAISDYDRFLELAPAREPHHWQRGIAYYYAGEYAKGRKQFEGYQTVDASDVENVVWRYLCMARGSSPEKAREEILPVGRDPRVPLEEVYELFRGRSTPEDVIEKAREGEPTDEELRGRLFYAHLYIGLFHEAHGERDLARKHIRLAATRHAVDHFMGDVARMHARLYERSRDDKGGKERGRRGSGEGGTEETPEPGKIEEEDGADLDSPRKTPER